MLSKCTNCGEILVAAAIKNELGKFCSKNCHDWYRNPGFCDECKAISTDDDGKYIFDISGFGTVLCGWSKKCTKCNSVQKMMFLSILMPIIPLFRKYRFKFVNRQDYVCRKLI